MRERERERAVCTELDPSDRVQTLAREVDFLGKTALDHHLRLWQLENLYGPSSHTFAGRVRWLILGR